MISLRSLAVALKGEVAGRQVLAPGPYHSPRDRSLAVWPSAAAPDGFLCHSHAGQDWKVCRDFVKEKLGLPLGRPPRELTREERIAFAREREAAERAEAADHQRRIDGATRFWGERRDPRGTVVHRHLDRRELELGDDLALVSIALHPAVTWVTPDGSLKVSPAMMCPMRHVHTDELRAVHLTFLSEDGTKLGRKMRGVARGAAIKLDPEETVTNGLHIGEGVETVLAGRAMGLKPAWALGSVGGIAAFPILGGVEALTLFGENDSSGASARACEECAERWHSAGREVNILRPAFGGDLNDVLMGRAAA